MNLSYQMSMNSVKVLGRDEDWHRSGVREAIYIHENKPGLNHGQVNTNYPSPGTNFCGDVCQRLKTQGSLTTIIAIKILVRIESLN